MTVIAVEPFTREYLLALFTRAPKAFWRWDVDFSLDAAVRMAEFAQIAGITGRFYIRPDAEFYNPFSTTGRAALARIHACGHQLGSHVDERAGGPAVVGQPEPWWNAASDAAHMFQTVQAVNARFVSFHMPTRDVLWRDLGLGDFESAYASRWKGHYVSDSRREWDAEKERRLLENSGEGMQCNLHSEHYF